MREEDIVEVFVPERYSEKTEEGQSIDIGLWMADLVAVLKNSDCSKEDAMGMFEHIWDRTECELRRRPLQS